MKVQASTCDLIPEYHGDDNFLEVNDIERLMLGLNTNTRITTVPKVDLVLFLNIIEDI